MVNEDPGGDEMVVEEVVDAERKANESSVCEKLIGAIHKFWECSQMPIMFHNHCPVPKCTSIPEKI